MSGPGPEWSPDRYAANARFVSDLGQPVVELLAPRAGERILDLGCGDGALTRKLAELGCTVVGVDASQEMIAAAVALGLDARVVDAHALPFDAEFDAVFTNAALHWMRDPDRVVRGVHRALKPGGRFVGECGGRGNVRTLVVALEAALTRRGHDASAFNPWHFASADEHRARLETHGFDVLSAQLFPRPTPLPGDVAGWLETFAQSFVSALAPADRAEYLAEVAATVRPSLCADGVCVADYVRLRFAARRRVP
jgi:SAM-dependent methyltransferase